MHVRKSLLQPVLQRQMHRRCGSGLTQFSGEDVMVHCQTLATCQSILWFFFFFCSFSGDFILMSVNPQSTMCAHVYLSNCHRESPRCTFLFDILSSYICCCPFFTCLGQVGGSMSRQPNKHVLTSFWIWYINQFWKVAQSAGLKLLIPMRYKKRLFLRTYYIFHKPITAVHRHISDFLPVFSPKWCR